MNFNNMGIIPPILKAIQALGYQNPTPIQQQAIPAIATGKDLIACAQTGTGKTAAFAVPILQSLHEDNRKGLGPQVLILVPTRELAIQISQNIAGLSKFLQVKHCTIFGGVSQVNQVKELKRGVDILIATPGRLIDLIGQGFVKLGHIRYLVLDEADNMLDMGFIHDLKKIYKFLPAKKQTLLFSATMPKAIRKLAMDFMHQPNEIAVSPVSSTAESVEQQIYFVEKKQKPQLLGNLIGKTKVQTLVFTRTKHGADRLSKTLRKTGIDSACIHGNKSQNARQKALQSFKSGEIHILIATDIAARGIDIQGLPLVVNFDLPVDAETYVHRIGRTGRAGLQGKAVSFCSEEEQSTLNKIQKLIGFELPKAETITLINTNNNARRNN
ncbi:DEAD/DEAH box helicase [Sphingobacterium humi]|uniref:DEAD-box ATP-dependent RNA helicase RhpA n=1 Tax=Sphingobacterium humi TaxID=1796905 RepID=A0A6N8KT67_9SPHI|nr:DEAD/DEAH box helicase [Sphingobacterium humi]MVZ60623.1 DEAD/DEAH box helicase [Sphingobacterium humi]